MRALFVSLLLTLSFPALAQDEDDFGGDRFTEACAFLARSFPDLAMWQLVGAVQQERLVKITLAAFGGPYTLECRFAFDSEKAPRLLEMLTVTDERTHSPDAAFLAEANRRLAERFPD